MFTIHRITMAAAVIAGVAATSAFAVAAPVTPNARHAPFIARFHKLATVALTVPGSGDVNPYGVAVVRHSEGRLTRGDVLISNFNDAKNLQGTGTTIVQVSPRGRVHLFAAIKASVLPGECPGGVGLTTALEVLPGGWVVVGNLPTKDGMADTAAAGCLIVLDKEGRVRETFAGDGIDGPWDMAVANHGPVSELFVTNVLDGTVAANGSVVHKGTVLRLVLLVGGTQPPRLIDTTTVGSGFGQRTDPAALVIGPTGLALAPDGTLYVADSLDSSIRAIARADERPDSGGQGHVVTSGGKLSTPLGLILAPDGDILTVNGGNGRLVETTPAGHQAAIRVLDGSGSPAGAGALFGLAVAPRHAGLYYVDDAANTLRLLH